MPPIESLTPEQEALIPVYREKWRALILSTERMERRRAEGALRAAYTLAGKADPEFQFFNGPQELQELWEQQSPLDIFVQRGAPVFLCDSEFLKRLQSQFTSDLWQQIVTQFASSGLFKLQYQLYSLSTYPLSGLFNQAMSEAWAKGQAQYREQLRQQPAGEFLVQLGDSVQQHIEAIWQELKANIWQPLTNQSFMQPVRQEWQKWEKVGIEIGNLLSGSFSQGGYVYQTMLWDSIDFCSSILNFSDADRRCWVTWRSVFRSCGVVVPFENLCLVIERPTRILLDAQGQIHADSEPAVTFADGSEFSAHHGDFKDLKIPDVN